MGHRRQEPVWTSVRGADVKIFMYEAEKVGISATGEEDENELYPNDKAADRLRQDLSGAVPGVPRRSGRHRPVRKPGCVSKAVDVRRRAFTVGFGAIEVWSVAAQFTAEWGWPPSKIRPLGDAIVRRREPASDTLAPDVAVTMLTIRFDGSIEPRARVRLRDIKGRLFRVHPDDLVFSKIDVRNGAIGLAPDDIGLICVTSEFPVYAVDVRSAEPTFVKLLLRTAAFRRILNSMISGASGRKRIQPSQLEKVRVPIPPLSIQRPIVSHRLDAERRREAADAAFSTLVAALDAHLTERTCAFKGITRAPISVARFKNTRQWDLRTLP